MALTLVTGLAVALGPGGSAGVTSVKRYDVSLQGTATGCATAGNSCLPGAAQAVLTLTVTNELQSNTSLGSVNLDAPTALPIDSGYAATTSSGTVTAIAKSGTGGELQLRDLNLAPGAYATVTFAVDTPCAGSGIQWPTPQAKQSNKFNGSGNDFTLIVATGLASDIAAGGCHVAFLNQPADTQAGHTITDGVGSTGGPIRVGLENSSGQPIATCPVSSCSVTISASPSDGTRGGTWTQPMAYDSGFHGLVASFGDLSIDGLSTLPETFSLTAAGSTGLGSDSSSPFQIELALTGCVAGQDCSIQNAPIDANSQVSVTGTGGAFTFLSVNTAQLDAAVTDPNLGVARADYGCAYFQPLDTTQLIENDGRSAAGGTLQFTYYVNKTLIAKKYATNSGQQFIPICAGAQQLDPVTLAPIPCLDGAIGGWTGDQLDSNGNFTGAQTSSVCYRGMWWGILGSFQDKVDLSASPSVTGWDSDTTYRYFYVRVPFPWDIQMGG